MIAVSPSQSLRSICWQLGEDFRCVLQSDVAEVLDYARPVLRAREMRAEASDETPMLLWNVERSEADMPWHAHGQTPQAPGFQSETLPELIAQIEYGALLSFLSAGSESLFSLHAALLSKNGRTVIVVGPKEAGKSTLACALWTELGWTLRGDDCVLVDTHNYARAAPRRVSLRHGSRALLGEPLWTRLGALPSTFETGSGLLFHSHELETHDEPVPTQAPSALFFLARRESSAGSAQTVAIPPALAALALLPYSTLLLPRGEELLCPSRVEWGASLPRLTAFASRVPAFDLGRGPLEAMTREVERLAFL